MPASFHSSISVLPAWDWELDESPRAVTTWVSARGKWCPPSTPYLLKKRLTIGKKFLKRLGKKPLTPPPLWRPLSRPFSTGSLIKMKCNLLFKSWNCTDLLPLVLLDRLALEYFLSKSKTLFFKTFKWRWKLHLTSWISWFNSYFLYLIYWMLGPPWILHRQITLSCFLLLLRPADRRAIRRCWFFSRQIDCFRVAL